MALLLLYAAECIPNHPFRATFALQLWSLCICFYAATVLWLLLAWLAVHIALYLTAWIRLIALRSLGRASCRPKLWNLAGIGTLPDLQPSTDRLAVLPSRGAWRVMAC